MEFASLFVCLFFVLSTKQILGQVGSLCRSNERLLTCGGCQKTCVDPVPRCEGICRTGCYCEEGDVRNATGHCIKLADCPPVVYKTNPDDVECPLNEEYRLCESCNKSCDNPNPICPAQCSRGCFCKEGLVRDRDGKCVKYNRCSKFTQIEANNITVIDKHNCAPHQVYKLCENCEKTCNNPNPKCPAQCSKGCFCDDGFYKTRNGSCVKLQDCPAARPIPPLPYQINCGPHQIFKICENCEKTCSNPNPICPAQCTRGCFCNDGFYKAPNGSCVKLEDCPEAEVTVGDAHDTSIDDCHPDEEFLSCGWCEPNCSQPQPECPLKICTSGCLCKPPLLRHWSGHCVEAKDCLPQRCTKPHEEFVCRYGCEPKCQKHACRVRPTRCTLGCHCKLGLLRDSSGNCVTPNKCTQVSKIERNNLTSPFNVDLNNQLTQIYNFK